MNATDDNIRQQVNHLVDVYRNQCLWFLRADYYPSNREDMMRVLDYIKRYGDREAFRQAGELCQWLSHDSSGPFAVL